MRPWISRTIQARESGARLDAIQSERDDRHYGADAEPATGLGAELPIFKAQSGRSHHFSSVPPTATSVKEKSKFLPKSDAQSRSRVMYLASEGV